MFFLTASANANAHAISSPNSQFSRCISLFRTEVITLPQKKKLPCMVRIPSNARRSGRSEQLPYTNPFCMTFSQCQSFLALVCRPGAHSKRRTTSERRKSECQLVTRELYIEFRCNFCSQFGRDSYLHEIKFSFSGCSENSSPMQFAYLDIEFRILSRVYQPSLAAGLMSEMVRIAGVLTRRITTEGTPLVIHCINAFDKLILKVSFSHSLRQPGDNKTLLRCQKLTERSKLASTLIAFCLCIKRNASTTMRAARKE